MGTENQAIDSMHRYMAESNRRIRQQETRPNITNASDLLGPGFGPTATEVVDWNSDEAVFNGLFYSSAGSLNAPEDSIEWFGLVIAEDENLAGVQILWSYDSTELRPREYRRRWRDDGTGVTRTYSAWTGEGQWQTTGITAIGSWVIVSQAWRPMGDIVAVSVVVTNPTLIPATTTGNVTPNIPVLQMPTALHPAGPSPDQGLGSGSSGRIASWAIDSLGVISLAAVVPGADVNPGSDLSVSGTYLL